MKKLLSLLLVAALLLSLCSVTAFGADGDKPVPTVGPAQGAYAFGGARCGIYNTTTHNYKYTVAYNYDQAQVVIDNEAIPGMTYNETTNTLKIDNLKMPNDELFIWYMGNDFKLNVVGECEIGEILVYNYMGFHNTSLSIIGSGTLTVNENHSYGVAINLFAQGDNSLLSLDVADTVTLHLYSAENKEDDKGEYYPVVSLQETSITPADGGAITVGGQAVPEAKNKQIVENVSDTVKAIVVDDPDEEFNRGKRVKSKSDPDGLYAMSIWDGVYYIVSRYVYSEELGLWVLDFNFRDAGYSGKKYTKAEFEAEYDYVYGQAPTKIEYADQWSYDHRGYEAVKIVKDSEPGAIYAGNVSWDDDEENPEGYTVYRVVWNEDEGIYQEDTDFESRYYTVEDLRQDGYRVVTETTEEKMQLKVWTSDDFNDPEGYYTTRDVLRRKSAPDDLFVQTGTYTSSDEDAGITMFRVHYDPEQDDFYILFETFDDPHEYLSVSYADLEAETDFYYDIQPVEHPVKLSFTDRYFSPNRYLRQAVQVSKIGDPDTVYAYTTSNYYIGPGSYMDQYTLIRLVYNDKVGCYFSDEEFNGVEFWDLDYLESNGYQIVTSEQSLDLYTKGDVSRSEYDVFTDNDGNTYYATYYYMDNIFRYTEDDLITVNGEQYYYGTQCPGLSREDLNDTLHDVVTDNYSYWIDGPEYHHVAGDAPEGYTLSGSLKTYLSKQESVYISLREKEKGWQINYMTEGSSTDYSIPSVPAGTYLMTVSKKDHVTRDYEVTVSGNTTQDVKIHPKGDISGDGRITSKDFAMAYAHAQKLDTLTGYALKCGDVVKNDGQIKTADAARIYAHAQKLDPLWTI